MPDSSPEAAVTAETIAPTAVTADQVSDGKSSESSTEEKPGGNMLDAVKAALKPKEASPASETPGEADKADPKDPTKPDKTDEDGDELSEEELKGLHGKVQKRFQRLTSKLNAKDTEIGSLKPKAAEFDKITTFVNNAGLTPQDVSELLAIGALLKSDPKAAYDRLLPTVQALQQHLGDILPADLQKQVAEGYLTEAHARELVASRSAANFAKQRAEQADVKSKEAIERDATKRLTDSTLAASESWEAAKAAKDPDWHLKRTEVAEQVELEIRREANKRGRPYFPTSEEVVTLSDAALKTVNDRMKRFAPRPGAIKPVTGNASTGSLPKPTSMLDVVKQQIGRMA